MNNSMNYVIGGVWGLALGLLSHAMIGLGPYWIVVSILFMVAGIAGYPAIVNIMKSDNELYLEKMQEDKNRMITSLRSEYINPGRSDHIEVQRQLQLVNDNLSYLYRNWDKLDSNAPLRNNILMVVEKDLPQLIGSYRNATDPFNENNYKPVTEALKIMNDEIEQVNKAVNESDHYAIQQHVDTIKLMLNQAD